MEQYCAFCHKNSTVRTIHGLFRHPRECIQMVLQLSWARMDIKLYSSYGEIIAGDRKANKNVLSVERTETARNRSLQKGTSTSLCSWHDGAMTEARKGDFVSSTSLDHLGSFEPHLAWPCKFANVEGWVKYTYPVQGKVCQKWCDTKDVFCFCALMQYFIFI